MGGMRTTKELIELCSITRDSYVLDLGCGVGATSCYLAKKFGCRVTGIDVSPKMIKWSKKRVQRDHVENRVELQVADAHALPFESNSFDVVLIESVLIFVKNKYQALSECVRVLRQGGFLGINEEIWLKPPTVALIAYSMCTWDIEDSILTTKNLLALLSQCGLDNLEARTYKFNASLKEYFDEITRYRFEDYLVMVYKAIMLFIKSSAFRKYIIAKYRFVHRQFFDYLGYGIYIGRKA